MTDQVELTRKRLEQDIHLLPSHMHEGITSYVMRGRPPGDFLRAILENDFMEAVGRADYMNQASLVSWARFLYNNVPMNARGSHEHVQQWIKQGGIEGIVAKQKEDEQCSS